MESFLLKLLTLINALYEHPESNTNELVFKCLVGLWESNEPILIPAKKDKDGTVYLASVKGNNTRNKQPILMTEKSIDGKELANTIIFNQDWLVFFTDDTFFENRKGMTLMYGTLDNLINHYKEHESDYLGIIVNPYQGNNSLHLTAHLLGVLSGLRDSYRESKAFENDNLSKVMV
jgi:hypothetical protein